MADHRTISSRAAAAGAGWRDGLECAEVTIRESDDPPVSETGGGWSDWGDHSTQSAIALRVPERWRQVYERAFERGAVAAVRAFVRDQAA